MPKPSDFRISVEVGIILVFGFMGPLLFLIWLCDQVLS